MELKNSFEVESPIDQVWSVFSDVEKIAPCLPGAKLEEVEGDEYKGAVKVKVGPITAQYKGVATFLERDEAARKLVIKAQGRDTKGAGNANATITVILQSPSENKTAAEVITDLSITGKVAQFGRGIMGDISSNLMAQFADNLSELLQNKPDDSKSENSEPENSEPRKIESDEVEAVDLLAASSSRFVRIMGTIGAGFISLVTLRFLRKKHK